MHGRSENVLMHITTLQDRGYASLSFGILVTAVADVVQLRISNSSRLCILSR